MHTRSAVIAAAVTGLLLSACASDDEATPLAAGPPTATASATPEPTEEPASAVDPASVEANELAMVPVMMYHQIKADVCDACVYDQTPAQFRAELERLHELDFVPITTAQLVTGDIDIPAGKHPVVLTFDDSSTSQIQIGPDGEPTADSAVGIMEAFAAENPDFPATGSFYINATSFDDPEAVPWLVEHGYEVGVHTVSHANLKESSAATIQKEIGQNIADISEQAPDAEVTTMAVPFGAYPENEALLRSGSYDGGSYTLEAALEVGANPDVSPFNAKFDPFAIARIRSGPKDKPVPADSTYWLDLLEDGSWTPYTSDGDPEKISFPSTTSQEIADEWADQANEYTPAGEGEDSAAEETEEEGSASESSSSSDAARASASPEPTS